MVVVLDTTKPRHPEKAHRPDAPALKKPDWIRVKAPVSQGYAETVSYFLPGQAIDTCHEQNQTSPRRQLTEDFFHRCPI